MEVTVDGVRMEASKRFDPKTNTTIITLQASVDSQICLDITGKTLIHDNADMLDRCAEIINAAELTYYEKEHLWNVLTQEFPNIPMGYLHGKMKPALKNPV